MTAPLLSLDELRRAVADGSIDTVLACLVDMQGRLMGKRFQGEYFVDSGHEETHCCNYLLANDIDMEPVPGYAAASWTQGYGDFVLKPDLSTLRRVPWLEGTALVLCDVQDHHHHDLPHSPRAILKRQVARLAERFAQHGQIADLVGQQQDQPRIEGAALFVAKALMGIDDGIVDIVGPREIERAP